MARKHLTKSLFSVATSCPTKLYYTRKDEFPDINLVNDFLKQLAEGGVQIGKLAHYKFSGGIEIETLDFDKSLKETAELMKKDKCIIYEAAFKYNNLFIRADVVVKDGNNLSLYEVKAKSFDSEKDNNFYKKDGSGFVSGWSSYLYDVTFQTFVIRSAYPDLNTTPFLTLVDTNAVCKVDSMYQLFRVERIVSKNDLQKKMERIRISVPENVKIDDIDTDILISVNVGDEVNDVISSKIKINFYNSELNEMKFHDLTSRLADIYIKDEFVESEITSRCAKCEFRANEDEVVNGKKDGQRECLKKVWNLCNDDFHKPLIFELSRAGVGSRDILVDAIKNKRYFLKEILESDYLPKNGGKTLEKGLSVTDRRRLQVEFEKNIKNNSFIDIDGLREEFSGLTYPINFIDFETIGPAIPFNKNMHPYEQIAFQFSHHVLSRDGSVEHKNEWINREGGVFPNFEFVRQLKKALSNGGSIFRYAPHENTILNIIKRQLENSNELDNEQLIDFIESITTDKDTKEAGERNMIDLHDWVKKYYFHPLMKGRTSIKVVLPAILNESDYLKTLYNSKNYKSKNFTEGKQWYVSENNMVKDPYKLLPPISELDELIEDADDTGGETISSGGPAMMNYAKLQNSYLSVKEKEEIVNALLRYCELDTLAMVMIFQHWKSVVG